MVFAVWGEGEVVATASWAPIPIWIAAVIGEEVLVVSKDDRFAVSEESGHLFLGAMRPHATFEALPNNFTTDQIAANLASKMLHDGADQSKIIFAGDSILCAEIFSKLQIHVFTKKIEVTVIDQGAHNFHEISHRTGFMIRDQDHKLFNMLKESQEYILRSRWRMWTMLDSLIDGTKEWMNDISLNSIGWNRPIFSIDQECLSELSGSRNREAETLAEISARAGNIFDIGDTICLT